MNLSLFSMVILLLVVSRSVTGFFRASKISTVILLLDMSACTSPLPAVRLDSGEISFIRHSVDAEYLLPCGQCAACRLSRARDWSLRIMHEQMMHEKSIFLTLTYSDDSQTELDHRHVQLFLKRLRRSTGLRVRYFVCGEYGGKTSRPHYHMCLFGYRPADAVEYKTTAGGHRLFTSHSLTELWSHGHCPFGDITQQSAEYCAKYTLKKTTKYGQYSPGVDNCLTTADGEVLKKEYCAMSLRPGIGLSFVEKHSSQIVNHGFIRNSNGTPQRIPPYYLRKLAERMTPAALAEFEASRMARAKQTTSSERARAHEVGQYNARKQQLSKLRENKL